MYLFYFEILTCTVEPLNNGDECFECSKVVPSSEVEMNGQYNYRQGVNSLGGCPLFRVSISGGATQGIHT